MFKNRFLADFELPDIPSARQGTSQVEVTFDVDANGIVQVSATELTSGRAQHIQIGSAAAMSNAEIAHLR